MASSRSKKPVKKSNKAPEPEATRADGRPKSLLTIAAEKAALEAKRELLLKTLKENDWNLSHTANALKIASASQVLRAIKETGLEDEYEEHRS